MELVMANGFEALEDGQLMEVEGGNALSAVCKFVTGTIVTVGVDKGIAYVGTKVAWVATATAGPVGGLAVLLVSGAVGIVAANILIQD